MTTALAPRPTAPMSTVAAAANAAAAHATFADYQRRRAAHTLRRQHADLAVFSRFLWSVCIVAEDLAERPAGWAGMTWGLVAAFVQWQLKEGYAVGTVNVRLATVKRYAHLAMQAGVLSVEAYAQICTVAGYRAREGRQVDTDRAQTRTGAKKAAPVPLTRSQADALLVQPVATDALLMALLFDHGLRISEVHGLQVDGFNLAMGTLTFYRSKVDKTQTHHLSDAVLRAAPGVIGERTSGPLWTVSERTLVRRVHTLGERIGVAGLSPHDCRHAWATFATRAGTATRDLQEAGGWASPAMPLRYAEAQRVANTGVKLR